MIDVMLPAGKYLSGNRPEAGPRESVAGCMCRHCDPNNWRAGRVRMHLCEFCGNKRCPHAEYHAYQCTQSNESRQIPVLAEPGPQKGPASVAQIQAQTKHVRERLDLEAKLRAEGR